MADFRGIQTVSNALVTLLRSAYDPDDFDGTLQFEAYTAEDYRTPLTRGVSLFLYRLGVNGAYRTPPGRPTAEGRFLTELPLDLGYLFTIWAGDAGLQHRLVGWLMRTLEDTPILPHGLLDAETPGAFHPDETVEVVPDDVSNEDLFRLAEILMPDGYRLSVPYLVRNVRIESREATVTGPPIHTRRFDLGDTVP